MITACDIRLCSQDAWFQIKVSVLYTPLLLCVHGLAAGSGVGSCSRCGYTAATTKGSW